MKENGSPEMFSLEIEESANWKRQFLMKGPIYIQLPHFQNFANLCAVFKTDPDQAGKVLLKYLECK